MTAGASGSYRVVGPAPRERVPSHFEPRRLARRALPVVAPLAAVGLVVVLAPGLGDVRDRLESAKPGWLAAAVVFEALSCVSYVLMFRPVYEKVPKKLFDTFDVDTVELRRFLEASGTATK